MMFTRAVAAGIALSALTAGAAAATTTPPSSEPPAGSAPTGINTGANPAGCVSEVESGTDLFPDKFEVHHAENYTIDYADTYKVVTVGATSPGAGGARYVLVQCGTEAPALEGDLAGAVVVQIPVTTMFAASSSHYGFIDVLDIESTVTGVGDGALVATPSLRERVDAGDIETFAPNYIVDGEVVVAADPDVFVTGGNDDPAYEVIAAAGVPVVANTEWLETTPQGWAEWVGLFAALTNTEARANALFAEWTADYEAAAALAAGVPEGDRPSVITGGLYEGTWYASSGDSIVAELIAAAGGDYVYDDNPETGSITLDIETVLADGADADVWLIPQGFTTRAEAVAADERLGGFAAWDAGGVWTNQVPADPEVNFLEAGPVMIDEYLLDYVAVLHPELAPDHELVFLSEVPAS